jgi:hypothetical protein
MALAHAGTTGESLPAVAVRMLRAAAARAPLRLEIASPGAWGEIDVVAGRVVRASFVSIEERTVLEGRAALGACLAMVDGTVEIATARPPEPIPRRALSSRPPPPDDEAERTTSRYPAMPAKSAPRAAPQLAELPSPIRIELPTPEAAAAPHPVARDGLLRWLSVLVAAMGIVALALIVVTAAVLGGALDAAEEPAVASWLPKATTPAPDPLSMPEIRGRERPGTAPGAPVEVPTAVEESDDETEETEARRRVRRTPRQARRESDRFIRRAEEHAARGHTRAARRALERAVRVAPQNPHAHAGLAAHLLGTGNLEDAREHAEVAVRLRRRRAEYRLLLGEILEHGGEIAGARAQYRRAARLAPRDPRPRERLRGLRR